MRPAARLGRAARFGEVFALAWLVLLWPVVGVYVHGGIPAARLAALTAAVLLYAGMYAWFCFAGYRAAGPLVPGATAAALALLGLAINHLSGVITANPYPIPLMVAGFGLRPRHAVPAIAALSVLAVADSVPATGLAPPEAFAVGALLLPQLLLWGLAALGLRSLLNVLAELRAARDEVRRLAAAEERARIARDLHDLLGQGLSLITLKGELAAARIGPDGPGAEEVRDMVALARDALRQVREAVSGYRQPTLATELAAARAALGAAGIDLDVEQAARALDRETEAALGWAIREGATNVIRHGRARRCSIVMARDDGTVRVDVTNDGPVAAARGPGNGLRGLEERLVRLGGRLEAAPLDRGGFRLRASVPVVEEAAAP
ncbi:MAG TPA: histidine kinase [Candidatus Dormibacteraeota bacterium]